LASTSKNYIPVGDDTHRIDLVIIDHDEIPCVLAAHDLRGFERGGAWAADCDIQHAE